MARRGNFRKTSTPLQLCYFSSRTVFLNKRKIQTMKRKNDLGLSSRMSFPNVTDRGWSEIRKRENPWWRWGLTLNAVPGLEFSFRVRLSQQLSLKYFKRQRYKSRFLRLVWCPCPLQMTAAHRQPWCDSPRQPRTKECNLAVMYRTKCQRQHHKIINLLFYSPVLASNLISQWGIFFFSVVSISAYFSA